MLGVLKQDRGFSLIEILVAALLVAFALIASLRLTTAVLGVVGRTLPPNLKPTRMRSVGTGWAQAGLEYMKQIGFDSACYADPDGTPPCELWAPQQCDGTLSSFPSEAPPPPPTFYAAHIFVDWDATGPPGPPATLLLVRAEVFRDQTECTNGTPFVAAYTSLSRR